MLVVQIPIKPVNSRCNCQTLFQLIFDNLIEPPLHIICPTGGAEDSQVAGT